MHFISSCILWKKTLNDLDVIALCSVYALFEVQECSAVIVN